jgi:hypothetical protein
MTATTFVRLTGVVGLFVVLSCTCSAQRKKSAPPVAEPAVIKPQSLIKVNEKLGPSPDKSSNKDSSFTLYKKDTTNIDNGMAVTKYVVVRNEDQRIVEEGSFAMGVIDWSADYELQITQSTGSAQTSGSASKRTIDLRPFLSRGKN